MARDLLVVLALTGWITVTAIATMIAATVVAGGAALAVLAVCIAPVVALGVPFAARRRATRRRRALRRTVGDPVGLGAEWRRQLAAAWSARDAYAAAGADLEGSPLADHVTSSQPTIDAALERCGVLARDGDQLSRQLRGFRMRTLRRDLRAARRADPTGPHARALADRLAEVDAAEHTVAVVRTRLDEQVHDLRTAAWRATELRTTVTLDGEPPLQELLDDLARLREALDEVAEPPQPTTAVDDAHDLAGRRASAAAARYDM